MDNDPMADLPAELKQNMTRYKAPPGLKRRVRYMLAQQGRGPAPLERLRASWMRWVPAGASFVCGGLVAVSMMAVLQPGSLEGDAVEQQVIASHVRSLMADHLTDVASTDQHTVKPWFKGKLDYSPPVVDLASEGFPLAGGRLDYVEDRPVAALVYRRRGHIINVFAMPLHDTRSASPVPLAQRGYQLARWDQAGMRFWAVSDVGRDELEEFAAKMKRAM